MSSLPAARGEVQRVHVEVALPPDRADVAGAHPAVRLPVAVGVGRDAVGGGEVLRIRPRRRLDARLAQEVDVVEHQDRVRLPGELVDVAVGAGEGVGQLGRRPGSHQAVEAGHLVERDDAPGADEVVQHARPDVGAQIGRRPGHDGGQQHLLARLARRDRLGLDLDLGMCGVPLGHQPLGERAFLRILARPVRQRDRPVRSRLGRRGAVVAGRERCAGDERQEGEEDRVDARHQNVMLRPTVWTRPSRPPSRKA